MGWPPDKSRDPSFNPSLMFIELVSFRIFLSFVSLRIFIWTEKIMWHSKVSSCSDNRWSFCSNDKHTFFFFFRLLLVHNGPRIPTSGISPKGATLSQHALGAQPESRGQTRAWKCTNSWTTGRTLVTQCPPQPGSLVSSLPSSSLNPAQCKLDTHL